MRDPFEKPRTAANEVIQLITDTLATHIEDENYLEYLPHINNEIEVYKTPDKIILKHKEFTIEIDFIMRLSSEVRI